MNSSAWWMDPFIWSINRVISAWMLEASPRSDPMAAGIQVVLEVKHLLLELF